MKREYFFSIRMALLLCGIGMMFFECTKPKPVEIITDPNDPETLVSGSLINLGSQVTEKHLEGSVFLKDDKGNDWLYTVVRGTPGYLLGYDLRTNALAVNLPLIQMDGAWDIAMSSDGWLYIAGSAGGRLARHKLGSRQIEDLGRPLAAETYLYALAAGKDGEIFGATYPGCRVFRYHPTDGFTDVGKGPIKAGENYVHAIAYYEKTDKLYAGIGSHSYLVELDPRTAQKKEILPSQYQGLAGFVYDMKILTDLEGGDRLLANLPDLGKTVVYNLQTEKFEEEIPRSIMVKSIVKSPSSQKVYYSAGWLNLYIYDFTKPHIKPEITAESKKALAMKWINDRELLILNSETELLKYNIESGRKQIITIEVPPQPIGLIAVAAGPDGRIWTGGYLVGSNAAYNPLTSTTSLYPGLNQSEGITVQGSNIYFGTYSRAEFYVYNTKLPWSIENNNPRKIGQAIGQDRPFGGVGVAEHNKMFFGTVPSYGKLGGTLVEYDVLGDRMDFYENVVPDHSIVSMTYTNGEVLGGTSVWGGLGIVPSASEAKLFGWDPLKKIKTFELVPVPDAKAITDLINSPDGKIWGMADGVLFIFDSVSKTVISRHKVYDVSEATKAAAVWRDADLVIHPSGQVYGTGGGKLFKIDPQGLSISFISTSKPAYALAMDPHGSLYFRNGMDLWLYVP